MAEELSILERRVLDAALVGDDRVLRCLQHQASLAQVRAREYTGVGFFLELMIPPDVARLAGAPSRFRIDDVVAEIGGLQHGAGFVVFVQNGALAVLEGFSYDEPWPPNVVEAKLSYRAVPRKRTWA